MRTESKNPQSNSQPEPYLELNDRLVNLFHTVSHNLGTYTSNINLLVDVILQNPEANHQSSLTYLRDISKDLNQTVMHLMQIAQVQNDGLTAKESLNLNEMINKIRNIINVYGSQTRAIIVNNVPEQTTVHFNPAYLESILLNFTTNAIRYAHHDRFPRIAFDWVEMEGQRLLTVADNGLGIDLKKHRDSLFGLYKTFHGHKDATGFGLYLCKYQIESMGARISVDSKVGKGTTFNIHFEN